MTQYNEDIHWVSAVCKDTAKNRRCRRNKSDCRELQAVNISLIISFGLCFAMAAYFSEIQNEKPLTEILAAEETKNEITNEVANIEMNGSPTQKSETSEENNNIEEQILKTNL